MDHAPRTPLRSDLNRPPKPWAVFRANLVAPDYKSEPIRIPLGVTRLSFDLISDPANPQGAAVVEILWSLATGTDDEDGKSVANFRSFPDAIKLTAAVPFAINRGAAGVGWIRADTTTPDDTADPSAKLVILLY